MASSGSEGSSSPPAATETTGTELVTAPVLAGLPVPAQAVSVPFLPAEMPEQPVIWPGWPYFVPMAAAAAGAVVISAGPLGMVGAVAAAGLLTVLGDRRLAVRALRRYQAAAADVIPAIARGEHQRVQATLVPWVRGRQGLARVHARHNLAWCELIAGRPATAIGLWATSEGEAALLKALAMHATCAVNLALAHALLGELPAARAWLDETERRLVSRQHLESARAMLLYARAVVACRDGRHAEAARDLEQGWSDAESVLHGNTARHLRIVRAFAVAAADPRDAGRVDRLLAPPAHPNEYAFLAVAWPEMAVFLAAHGLTFSA